MLEDGVMVGRIFQVKLAPEGKPWIWASVHNGDLGGAAHGYEAMLAGFADLFLLLVTTVPQRGAFDFADLSCIFEAWRQRQLALYKPIVGDRFTRH